MKGTNNQKNQSLGYQPLLPHELESTSGLHNLDSSFKNDSEIEEKTMKKYTFWPKVIFVGNKLRRIIIWSVVILLVIFLIILWNSHHYLSTFIQNSSRISDIDKLKNFEIEPNDCKKTLMFKFLNWSGFFSEVLIFTRFATKARSLGYTILIDDHDWNYGKIKLPRSVEYKERILLCKSAR
ncbi:expressed protein [Phakopsora pachyrhizi]|uniref:Expressed protein n=1 Tax=Phakopsora pachyrhizi TaxID=170000 RepID=A0AAV0BEM2_PHAPC|nr:expressed protein [Phakopsora pachyrhizi]